MRRSPDFVVRTVGGQDLLVPIGAMVGKTNSIVVLNLTGRYIWDLLAEDRSPGELAAMLAARFGIDRERADADVRPFLDDLGRMGLLEP